MVERGEREDHLSCRTYVDDLHRYDRILEQVIFKMKGKEKIKFFIGYFVARNIHSTKIFTKLINYI